MNTAITIKRKVHFAVAERSRNEMRDGNHREPPPAGNVPRIARLMALAIRFGSLIRDGHIRDQAELARVGHVTRARLTQIMNLLNLAPDIQEEILFLPRTGQGRDPVFERQLRPIAAELDWRKQKRMWTALRS